MYTHTHTTHVRARVYVCRKEREGALLFGEEKVEQETIIDHAQPDRQTLGKEIYKKEFGDEEVWWGSKLKTKYNDLYI